jgi:drug/metabolite transporter (DMT)-like permease
MAKAVGGFLIAPIVSGLLGILVWREPPTVPRLAGSGVSFLGAAVLVRPETGIEPGCLLALLGGALLGAYLAATRGARTRTDALSTLAVQSLLGAALVAPFVLAGGLPASGPRLLVGALALGGISAACHFLTVAAYQRADASVLAPFLYFNLLTAGAVGFLWFGETLPLSGVLALLAIAGGGLIALMRPGWPWRPRRLPPRDRASRDSMVVP